MAAPALLKILPKLLPAAKLAYDHRDKAVTLYKKIQLWRNKETSSGSNVIDVEEVHSVPSHEEQIDSLKRMIAERDDIIAEQSDILAKLANDLTELSTLTDRLRRRSQWLMRGLYLGIIVLLIRFFFF